MPWTTPRTWSPGELVTADMLNDHLRDNLLYLYDRLSIGARVARTSNQSIPQNSWTALSFATERYDTDNLFSATFPTRLTAQTPGKYLITAHIAFAAAQARKEVKLRVNGGIDIAQHTRQSNGVAQPAHVSLATVYALSAGQYVELLAWHEHGAALNVLGTPNVSAELSMQWLAE
jgi:hypothetical protein